MKKIFLFLGIISLMFTSCDDVQQISSQPVNTVDTTSISILRGGNDYSFAYGDQEGVMETNDGTTFTPVPGETVIYTTNGCTVVDIGSVTYTIKWRQPRVLLTSPQGQPVVYESPGKGEVLYRGMIYSTTLGNNC